MGLVGKEPKEEVKEAEAPEDPPIVKQLKEIDDKYLELEKEYEKESQKLLLQFQEKQKPLLDERKKVLTADEEGARTGTPALSGFWMQALGHHPACEDSIQEWDAPVFEFLADIERENIDEADGVTGFKLSFHFVENPYFSNEVLTKEYRMVTANPYSGEIEVKEIKCSEIKWKAGKDVTVAMVAKKVKGGGSKKNKQKAKETEEPRPSFFRDFFRTLTPGMELPEDAKAQAMGLCEDEDDDPENDEEILAYLMEADHEMGSAMRDHIIPFAVRWYTGEAAPDMDDDDDDEDEEEEEEDEDSEEDSDNEPKGKGKGKGGKGGAPKKKAGGKAGGKGETKPGEAPKEECKQQ